MLSVIQRATLFHSGPCIDIRLVKGANNGASTQMSTACFQHKSSVSSCRAAGFTRLHQSGQAPAPRTSILTQNYQKCRLLLISVILQRALESFRNWNGTRKQFHLMVWPALELIKQEKNIHRNRVRPDVQALCLPRSCSCTKRFKAPFWVSMAEGNPLLG